MHCRCRFRLIILHRLLLLLLLLLVRHPRLALAVAADLREMRVRHGRRIHGRIFAGEHHHRRTRGAARRPEPHRRPRGHDGHDRTRLPDPDLVAASELHTATVWTTRRPGSATTHYYVRSIFKALQLLYANPSFWVAGDRGRPCCPFGFGDSGAPGQRRRPAPSQNGSVAHPTRNPIRPTGLFNSDGVFNRRRDTASVFHCGLSRPGFPNGAGDSTCRAARAARRALGLLGVSRRALQPCDAPHPGTRDISGCCRPGGSATHGKA